jgi:cysteinyl-tRNA synthetase
VTRLFNSMDQRKEEFVPRDEGKVGIYCCGPTVYNLVHIGNARPYVTFAVLRNWLRHRGYDVTLVENITDVDDKIINKANAEGRSPAEVATEFTDAYHEDMGRLGAGLRPDVEPLATETIAEIIDLCCTLIQKGHAYAAEGSVYFRVRSFAGYGKLSGQRVEDLEQGARVTAEPGKEDDLDFAVWKAAKPGEPAWESPWGMGRPGWHIECSAMGLRYLGPGFDIHGGGRDLIFPHHENEIAQSEAAGLPFARYWLHNGMIRSEGEKMAKSVGNIFLLREVLDRYGDAEHGDAPVVMLYFLTTHYRSPLEFSVSKLDEAKASYQRLSAAVRDIDFRLTAAGPVVGAASESVAGGVGAASGSGLAARVDAVREAFAVHMDDDLNTAAALGELFALIGDVYRHLAQVDAGSAPLDAAALRSARQALEESCGLLFVRLPKAVETVVSGTDLDGTVEGPAGDHCPTGHVPLPSAVKLAVAGRWEDLELLCGERLACGDPSFAVALRDHYREVKDWTNSDRLRAALQDAGFEVRDTKQGTQVVPR